MTMGPRLFVAIAGIYGAIGVSLGAFGAHALRARLAPDRLARLETGVRYLFTALPGLLACAALAHDCAGGGWITASGIGFTFGVLVFTGSLVAYALTGARGWGRVTPFGGALLVVGWLCLVGAAFAAPGSGGGPTLSASC